jgi:hypothetical protein
MRIIGEQDYYDGSAYCRNAGVASLIVYRRSDAVMHDRDMRRTLGVRSSWFAPGIVSAEGTRPSGGLTRLLRLRAAYSWRGMDLTISQCEALFCGNHHRGAVLSFRSGWSSVDARRTVIRCWTAEAYEEALAMHGLVAADDVHLGWFTMRRRVAKARAMDVTVATRDASDVSGGSLWRIDGPTLGSMGFAQIIGARHALEEVATWLGRGETRCMRYAAENDRMMTGIAGGGR